MGEEGSGQVQLPTPLPTAGSAALPFCQSPGGSSKCMTHKEGGPWRNKASCRTALLSRTLLTTFCRAAEKCPKPSTAYSVSPLALRQRDMGRREGGVESEAENYPCSCHCKKECFLLSPTTARSDKQPSMHMSTRAHAHACPSSPCRSHLSLSPENLSFHSKGCALCVSPKSHSSNGDASPLCKSAFLRAAN